MRDVVVALLRQMREPVVVECGAHFGYDTQRLVAAAPTGTFFAFEPDPRNIAVFRERGLDRRVTLVEAAVADVDGTAVLHQSSGRPFEATSDDTSRDWSYSSSLLRPARALDIHRWCSFPTAVEVATRSLDSFVRERQLTRIDLLWADIQGAEREMIAGGQETLRKTRYLFTEYSNDRLYEGQPSFDEIVRLLPGEWCVLNVDSQFVLLRNDSLARASNPRILIGALSGWQYAARRQRCRETWFADARRHGLDAVFLLGAGDRVERPVHVDDVLLLPCPDDYPSLPQRTRWFCRWALERCDWDYLFKCDDDTYVCVERLRSAITEGRDYIGGEWAAGVNYGSGGAGYLLSRRAAQIVADRLNHDTGAEDQLVGQTLAQHGITLHIDTRFIAIGNEERRPRCENDLITTHAISADLFRRSHRELGARWKFRIVIPTCNAYTKTVLPVTLQLLKRYWPDHPAVDLVCYDIVPDEVDRVTTVAIGPQDRFSWCAGMKTYLERYNSDQLVLLMLDDYGLCAPPDRVRLLGAQQRLLASPCLGIVHLTWQPAHPKTMGDDGLLRLPPWKYSIHTQGALWRRDLLLEALQAHATSTIEDFELSGSRWYNAERASRYANCQIPMPEPANPSGFVDETDKTHWVLPYHNLMRRGAPDPRHAAFLADHKLVVQQS